jgi:integrase/recombinase XerD
VRCVLQSFPRLSNLIPASPDQPANRLDLVPEESVWLANFTSTRTRRTYRDSIGRFIAFHGLPSAAALRAITPAHVIAWRDAMLAKGDAHRTIHTRLSAPASLMDHLCDQQLIAGNPVDGIRRPKVNQHQVKSIALTPQQVRRLLDAPDLSTLKGKRDSALLHLLFFTGARIAEPCRLKVGDFFEDAGYRVLDFTVKGSKTNRLAIHQELQVARYRYLSAAGHGEDREAPLLRRIATGDHRAGIAPRQALNLFHHYARQCGLPTAATPHSARATFITQALENGCKLEAVQQSVVHANIQTMRMYDKRTSLHRESASFSVRF